MSAINDFLVGHNLRINSNPCISPDFCLDWKQLSKDLQDQTALIRYPKSHFSTLAGDWELVENPQGDHAWILTPNQRDGSTLSGPSIQLSNQQIAFPATWNHLLEMKNRILEFDPKSTIFPSVNEQLGQSTIGVGARFTTLHWPGVDWAMSHLGIGLTANQNSIPRELVFDVDAMLAETLEKVPFPFIGTDVPEGHQGQSVEGMSHGCVLAKLKSGFHRRRIAWSFNADHQPIGGHFDRREDQLVRGCLLATYITFDLSPELSQTRPPENEADCVAYVQTQIDSPLLAQLKTRIAQAGLQIEVNHFNRLLATIWPAMQKMKIRDEKYQSIRQAAFSEPMGRQFLRELSIDELPGITTRETTAIILALCEVMEMPVQFLAPAFGFQKNMPYPDNQALRELISAQWDICQRFGVSIGFHSGSGKSAENYQVMGDVTKGRLEIKTSGRYTYEMGIALSTSSDLNDQELWIDWYHFALEMAINSAFSEQKIERSIAREFIEQSLLTARTTQKPDFTSPENSRRQLESLKPSPEYMFWFEYNFLFVLAAEGRAQKKALGDHSPEGYQQRARFYTISNEGRLNFAKRVATYLIFLTESTGLVSSQKCKEARNRLNAYPSWDAFFDDIAP